MNHGNKTGSNGAFGEKEDSGSRKTTGKGLVIWKLRNTWRWIHHSPYLGRETDFNEAGKEVSP